jgi:hypothetical protein
MVMPPLFDALLQWLASNTGARAHGDAAPVLDFSMPANAPTIVQAISTKPVSRLCCALGGNTSPSLDPAALWQGLHEYKTGMLAGGGSTGYMYTRHGGFIDLGHARDYIDMTRYMTQMYRDAAGNPMYAPGMPLRLNEGADLILVAEPVRPSPEWTFCALMGAKLAFEQSVWHEVYSYFPQAGGFNQKYSSFAPEDLFSNAVGVVAGFRALVFHADLPFDVAADRALKDVLESLGPVSKDLTEQAIQYVEDRWWESSLLGTQPETKRRNFLSAGPLRPWLVTDLAIRGKEARAAELVAAIGRPSAASIAIPTHYTGILLEQRGRLRFDNPIQDIKNLVPQLAEIRSIDLLTVSSALRAHARRQETSDIDSP